MIRSLSVKIVDHVGLNERETNILQTATMNYVAMTSALLVGQKKLGGVGAALNPLEDERFLCGITLIYDKAIDRELAEELKSTLEKKFITFFSMSEIDMTVEVDLL